MEHTPIPWKIQGLPHLNAHHKNNIMIDSAPLSNGGGPQYICEVYGTCVQGDAHANAAYIVQAVNNHKELVRMLHDIDVWLMAPRTDQETINHFRHEIQAILQRIGEGQ